MTARRAVPPPADDEPPPELVRLVEALALRAAREDYRAARERAEAERGPCSD